MAAETVKVLVTCSCHENHKKKIVVQSSIALAGLIKEVEDNLACSQGIELKCESTDVVLKDPLNLGSKTRLKAEKVGA